MQLLISNKTRAVLGAATVFFCLSSRCFADPIALTSSALSSTVLDPSSDSISLNAGSIILSSDSGSTIFQTGDFYLGNSPIADQIIPLSFQDTLTLNGITQVLNFFGQDNVTTTADTLSIFASAPVVFGDEYFTLDSFSTTGTTIGEDLPIDLQVTATPTPEPTTLLLLVTGIVAVIFFAPATRRSIGSSTGTATPPVNFIKMPVPARSWAQRGATFHPAAAKTARSANAAVSASVTEGTDLVAPNLQAICTTDENE